MFFVYQQVVYDAKDCLVQPVLFTV